MFTWIEHTPTEYEFDGDAHTAHIESDTPGSWRIEIQGIGRMWEIYHEEFATVQEAKQFAVEKIKYFTDLRVEELNGFNRWYDCYKKLD